VPAGVLMAFAAYLLYSCGDAAIKAVGAGLSPFQIGFFAALFSVIPAALAKSKDEHWRHAFRSKRTVLLHLRSISSVVMALLVILAFTTIPFAEVYSAVFTAPIFVALLSMLVLKEHVPGRRWVLLITSFIGVLLVVRPGFRELSIGHFAAFACAGLSAFNTIALRLMAASETRVSLVGVAASYALVVNGIGMSTIFVPPTLEQWALLLAVGALGGTGQLLLIAAVKRVGASQVSPTQYSQIIWAVLLGAMVFAERPDPVALVGMAIVVTAGLLNLLLERRPRQVAAEPIARPDDPAGNGPA
jgi:drug/metabolite transporter (DMT)-like permease